MYAEVRTAFSVAEALNIGEVMLLSEGEGTNESVLHDPAVLGLYDGLRDLAHAVWSPEQGQQSRSNVAADVLSRTRIAVNAGGLQTNRPSIEVKLELVSAGIESDMRQRWQDYFAGNVDRDLAAPDRDFMVKVAEEGVLDWALRCATNPDFEVRRCLCCGDWFLPQRAGRSRFCAARCRNAFHFLKVDEAFTCVHCHERQSIQQWSGLIYDRKKDRIAIIHHDLARRICCNCILKNFLVWERYLAPGLAALKHTRVRVASGRRSRR